MKLLPSILLFCLTTSLYAARTGNQLYDAHCAACHGNTGQGGVGVPLALQDFQATVSDHYLYNSIKLGRPGRVMPAFSYLTDLQIKAIVKHIRSFTHVTPPAEHTGHIQGNIKRGKALFAKNCAACHGKYGQGGRGTGVTFSRPRNAPIIAPALNNRGFLKAATDSIIKQTLMNGRRNTPMKSFLKQGLDEKDIDNIVAYIRNFEKTPPLGDSLSHDDTAILVAESPYSLERTLDNLRKAVIGKNFRIIREQYLEHGLVKKGHEDKNQVILYFCNFKFLNDSLKIDPRVGMFLPCRITLVQDATGVKVMAINPLKLSQLFNNDELNDACKNMRSLYEEIIEEATL